MQNNNLGAIITLAQGERSLREYGRDSGIDAAIISRMKSGKYIPKKLQIYKALTSEKAAPRGGVTYEKMLEAAGFSNSFNTGVIAGMAATNLVLATMGSLPLSLLGGVVSGKLLMDNEKKKMTKGDVNSIDKLINDLQRFSAMVTGVIYGILAEKNIIFKPTTTNRLMENEIDTYIEINNQPIKRYILGYLYLDEDEQKSSFLVENASKRIIERFIFLKPNKNMKISVVTNSKEAYDFLLRYKNELSYRGYLSIMLMNMESIKIDKEDYISFYDEEIHDEVLRLI